MAPYGRPTRFASTALLLATLVASPCSAESVPEQVQWRELGPPARSGAAMVWDSRRGRALLFGGDGAFGVPYPGTWQFLRAPRPHWEPLATTLDGPPARTGMCAVYDSVGDRVLLFGGRGPYGDFGTNELWQLRLNDPVRWRQLQYAPGPAPSVRFDATMILDSQRRLVLYGGDGGGSTDDAVWFLPLTEQTLQWRKLEDYTIGPGPGPRARHSAMYSASRNRMLVFGGEQKVVGDLGFGYAICPPQAWSLMLDPFIHWEAPTSLLSPHPVAEVGGALEPDSTGRHAWLVPGNQDLGVNDPALWSYDFETRGWTRANPGFGGPGPRGGVASCLDPTTSEIILHGGAPASQLYQGMTDSPLSETWGFLATEVSGWIPLCRVPGVADRPWSDPRAHFDEARRRLVTWTREGVWTCDVGTDATWHLETVSPGDGPQYDNSMSAIDPVRRRLLVFGGQEFTNSGYIDRDADRLWSWPLDGPGPWSSVQITGPTPAHINGTQCAFDAIRDRVIALPSNRDAFAPLDTLPVIALAGDAAQWTRLPVAGNPPPPRSDGTVLMDPIHDRMFVQGGTTSTIGDGTYAQDLWSLAFATDTRMPGPGNAIAGQPRWRLEIYSPFAYEQAAHCGLAVDPTLGRILLVGGEGLTAFGIGPRNEIESTAFDDPATWENLDPTSQSPMLGGGPLAFDAAADRMLWWNGRQLWEITWPFGTPAPYGPAVVNAGPASVDVRWPGQLTDPYTAAVDRSVDGGRTWQRLRSVAPQSDGSLAFADSSLAPGSQAAYRASIERSGATHVLGTASTVLGATIPATLRLAAPRPNPASDDVVIELGAPAQGTVTLELFDVAGRLAAPVVRRAIPAGTTVFTAPLARGLSPGLYLLRASDGRQSVNARLVVTR